jgi:hypothetical protein
MKIVHKSFTTYFQPTVRDKEQLVSLSVSKDVTCLQIKCLALFGYVLALPKMNSHVRLLVSG